MEEGHAPGPGDRVLLEGSGAGGAEFVVADIEPAGRARGKTRSWQLQDEAGTRSSRVLNTGGP